MEPQYPRQTFVSDLIRLKKAELWEEAKGKMRAMVNIEGSCDSFGVAHAAHRERWRQAEIAIEAFIKSFEDDDLHA